MPFDEEKRNRVAVQSQVGDIAIDVAVAIDQITDALRKIALETGVDVTEYIDGAEEVSKSLSETFDKLTGYKAESKDAG